MPPSRRLENAEPSQGTGPPLIGQHGPCPQPCTSTSCWLSVAAGGWGGRKWRTPPRALPPTTAVLAQVWGGQGQVHMAMASAPPPPPHQCPATTDSCRQEIGLETDAFLIRLCESPGAEQCRLRLVCCPVKKGVNGGPKSSRRVQQTVTS